VPLLDLLNANAEVPMRQEHVMCRREPRYDRPQAGIPMRRDIQVDGGVLRISGLEGRYCSSRLFSEAMSSLT
jgi:hypothetical protein